MKLVLWLIARLALFPPLSLSHSLQLFPSLSYCSREQFHFHLHLHLLFLCPQLLAPAS